MHRFWDITELVLSVILLLSKCDQARLARVNHGLWKIAIAEIWSSVPDFRYFMFLLPPKLRGWSKDTESYHSSSRQPLPARGASDLDRLILHSQTTKTLHYRIQLGASQVPIWIWNHDKLSTALPNLRSLKVSFAPWTPRGSIDTVSLLLRPTLRRVRFFVETSAANLQLSPALRIIAQSQALSLEEMSLHCPWGVQSLLDDGCAAILSQRNLQRLRLRSLADVTALACAARDLPVLRELDVESLRSPLTAGAQPADEPQPHFPSLVTLKASGFPAELGMFLKNVASKVLAHVGTDIEVRSPGVMDPDFFLVLHAFRATLTTLEVTIRGDFTWIGLEPILDLGDLQNFSLTYNNNATNPQVEDAQVLRMTKAWPRLTSLFLSTRSRKANLTLRSLGHIACNCPNLRTLLVAFDGTRQGNFSYLPPDDTNSVHREMELVDLLWSEYDPGDELRITTSFLRRWWPRAEIVGSRMGAERGMRWQEASTASRVA